MASIDFDQLDGLFAEKLKTALQDCAQKGIVMVPYQGIRDPWEQARLWRRSRSTAEVTAAIARLEAEDAPFLSSVLREVGPQKTGTNVTNALPGFSWHQWGEAVDSFWSIDGKAEWDDLTGYKVYAEAGEAAGLTAGGRWTSQDWPHLQLRPEGSPSKALTVQEIDAAMRRRFGRPAVEAAREFVACRSAVHNRGKPPLAFLEELVAWGRQAPVEIFAVNDRHDIYSVVQEALGPWEGELHRRVVMLEVLRVLGGFESSWDWTEGRDITNPSSNTACTEEAGIFQCSGNSMNFDASLRQLLQRTAGRSDCETFREVTKTNHAFALEYSARLLRFTVNHHGPVKRGEILPWLRRDAVAELRSFL